MDFSLTHDAAELQIIRPTFTQWKQSSATNWHQLAGQSFLCSASSTAASVCI